MIECDDVIAGIERDGRGIYAFLGGLGSGRRLAGRLAFAHTQVEAGSFQQLALLRIALENGSEEGGGA